MTAFGSACRDRGRDVRNEKRFVTLVSVAAAVFLTAGKLVVGLITGSLAILSEAAHSALDGLASVMTFFAVRVSDRPADFDHAYGHGKIENLSALLQAALLLVVCLFIVREAAHRIFHRHVAVEANALAFGMVIVSIAIDLWRSRALRRAAVKYKSQALEADALNFTMDLWSSAVVLLGLGLVKYGEYTGGGEAFHLADAAAALVVTAIIFTGTVRLAKRAVDVLMDRAPAGMRRQVEMIARGVDGVIGVHHVRVRPSGNRLFIDLHVCVARNLGFEPSHRIAEAVENAVRAGVPDSDVIVHVDPRPGGEEPLADRVRVVSANIGVPVHHLHLHKQNGKVHLDLDLEVDADLSLNDAHQISRRLERSIRAEVSEIDHVHTHIEPRRVELERTDSLGADAALQAKKIREIVQGMPYVVDCHAVEVERIASGETLPVGGLVVSLHCTFAQNASIEDVHASASAIERSLKQKFPEIRRVLVHTEPAAKRKT